MSVYNKVLNALFPPHCCVCDCVITGSFPVCKNCKEVILRRSFAKGDCECCGLKKSECICNANKYYDALCFPFFYSGNTRKTLQKYKFNGRTDFAKPYADMVFRSICERGLCKSFDEITFIPMTKEAERKRGYNQARLIAENVAKKLDLPCKELLTKVLKSPAQHTLGASRRRGNILGAFEVLPNNACFVDGKKILVIDDIVTGGSTLNEAAKTLLIFGADKIYGACVAATEKTKKTLH